MAKHWIQEAIHHPGALTRKAKAAGMTVKEYEAHPPKNASTQTKEQIALAERLQAMHHPK